MELPGHVTVRQYCRRIACPLLLLGLKEFVCSEADIFGDLAKHDGGDVPALMKGNGGTPAV